MTDVCEGAGDCDVSKDVDVFGSGRDSRNEHWRLVLEQLKHEGWFSSHYRMVSDGLKGKKFRVGLLTLMWRCLHSLHPKRDFLCRRRFGRVVNPFDSSFRDGEAIEDRERIVLLFARRYIELIMLPRGVGSMQTQV